MTNDSTDITGGVIVRAHTRVLNDIIRSAVTDTCMRP